MRLTTFVSFFASISLLHAESFLVEAEHFAQKGGWMVDTQFVETVGSPYLIAHGMGKPVADATTQTTVEKAGRYHVWVRSIDWTKRLGRSATAATFGLSINGQSLSTSLGQGPTSWSWIKAGEVSLEKGEASLTLKDQTGFDARIDALYFTTEKDFTPPAAAMLEDRAKWGIPGAPKAITDAGEYDLVVIGGGYGGMGAAIAAARMGAKVALVQNRDVLGGNGSSEIRVWAMGDTPPSEYGLADIIKEIEDDAKASPAPAEQFGDTKKESIVRAEKNITLLLGHHAYGVEMAQQKIAAVRVLEVATGQTKRLKGHYFADCTGHGFIGQWANADRTMVEKGRMGMSNMWMWRNAEQPTSFPHQPWMLTLTEKDFPYPRRGHAEWFWESGFDRHPIEELEVTRDWNLISAYSAFSAMKNQGAHAARDPQAHAHAEMTWLAFVGGTRETQQLLGDVILTGDDIEKKTAFPDGCVLTTWSIDLHVPEGKFVHANPEHPFISKAIFRHSVDKRVGYPIPYRCFYSRNVPNLFMAGRNISVNRDALGTIRVMKTIGMMGVCVGRTAALCRLHTCSPRDAYEKYLDQAKQLWRLSGKERYHSLVELEQSLKKAP